MVPEAASASNLGRHACMHYVQLKVSPPKTPRFFGDNGTEEGGNAEACRMGSRRSPRKLPPESGFEDDFQNAERFILHWRARAAQARRDQGAAGSPPLTFPLICPAARRTQRSTLSSVGCCRFFSFFFLYRPEVSIAFPTAPLHEAETGGRRGGGASENEQRRQKVIKKNN